MWIFNNSQLVQFCMFPIRICHILNPHFGKFVHSWVFKARIETSYFWPSRPPYLGKSVQITLACQAWQIIFGHSSLDRELRLTISTKWSIFIFILNKDLIKIINTVRLNIREAMIDKHENIFLGSRRLNTLHFAHEAAICRNPHNPSKSDSITNTPPV